MLREMTARMGMNLRFIEQTDCENSFASPESFRFDLHNLSWHCDLVGANLTVNVARFSNLFDANRWNSERYQAFFMTTSFIEQELTALNHVSETQTYGMWRVFAPFDNDMWIGLGLMVVLVSFVMPGVLRGRGYVLLHKSALYPGAVVRAEMLYHSLTELMGASDLEWTHSLSARLLRLGWSFFALISVSSCDKARDFQPSAVASPITLATLTAIRDVCRHRLRRHGQPGRLLYRVASESQWTPGHDHPAFRNRLHPCQD